jgi:hypothetical protein
MGLRDAYRAELARAEAGKPDSSPYDVGMVQLRAFATALPAELEAMKITPYEVEMFEDELRLDTGPCMIVVRVTPAGAFRLAWELKRPDDYTENEIPEAKTIEDLEAAIAKLLI